MKHAKKAFLASLLATLLCVTMLIGTTFAWFTDSVTSGGNIIKSGTLDVEMKWANGTEDPAAATWTDASAGPMFTYELWEPGYVEVKHIDIANVGTLALKYQVRIVANGMLETNTNGHTLAEAIDVYYADPAVQVTDRTDLTDSMKIGTLAEVLTNINGTTGTAEGVLYPAGTDASVGKSEDTITLALKMREEAGNEYQNMSLGTNFSVQLLATQYTWEKDSFDELYDELADGTPDHANWPADVVPTTVVAGQDTVVAGKGIVITVPEGSDHADAGDQLTPIFTSIAAPSNFVITTTTDYLSYDISVVNQNGEKIVPPTGETFEVEIEVGDREVSAINHYKDGSTVESIQFTYDAARKTVKFMTASFSPYVIILADTYESMETSNAEYTSLANAIVAVPDNTPTTIKLLSNEAVFGNAGLTIGKDQDITIDLNGYSIIGYADAAATSQTIKNTGRLTIIDSSKDQKGSISNAGLTSDQAGNWWETPQRNYANNVILNSGYLEINGGSVVRGIEGNIAYAIDNNSTSYDTVCVINGGKVQSGGTAIRMFCNSNTNENSVSVQSGEVTGGYAAIWVQLPGKDSAKHMKASVNISGGTVSADSYAFYDYSDGNGFDNVSYHISGGTLNGDVFSYGAKNFAISGGTVNGSVYSKGTIDATGGTITGKVIGNYVTVRVWYGNGYVESAVVGDDYILDTEENLTGSTVTATYYGGTAEEINASDIVVSGTVITIKASAIHELKDGNFCIWIKVSESL